MNSNLTNNSSGTPEEIAWSFGCLLGHIFHQQDTEKSDPNLSCVNNIPLGLQFIYKKCLAKNPLKRPSKQVLRNLLSSVCPNNSGDTLDVALGHSSLSNVDAAPENFDDLVVKFYKDMEPMVEEMENMMRESTLLPAVKANSHLDMLVVNLKKLQEFVTEASKFLPLYDVKKSQMTISSLNTQFQEKQEKMKPKKLGFKRSKQMTISGTVTAPDISSLSVVDAGPGYSNSCSLSNMTDQVVILTKGAGGGQGCQSGPLDQLQGGDTRLSFNHYLALPEQLFYLVRASLHLGVH